MKRFAFLAIPFAFAACGDNNPVVQPVDAPPVDIDAQDIDARVIDAPPPIDAPVQTFSGTVSVVEARLKNMGGAGVDGHGIQIGVSFTDNLLSPPPIDATPGATTTSGCFVWRYDAAQLPGLIGTNQGNVQVTIGDGDPVFPPCTFRTGEGYVCADAGSTGTMGSLTMLSANTSLFTIADTAATFGAEDVGRYLFIGTPVNKALPIVLVQTAKTAVVAGAGLTLAGPLSFETRAGVGPVPDLAAGMPRSFLGDDDAPTITKTGGTEVGDFSASPLSVGGATVGDDFTLGTATSASTPMIAKVLPTSIPTDGSEFVIGCDTTGACGNSIGALVNIVTTNATVSMTNPFDFPTGTSRTQIRCANLTSPTGEVRVPASISAHLRRAESGANRIQVTYIRGNFAVIGDVTPPNATTNFLGGHGEVGFVTVP